MGRGSRYLRVSGLAELPARKGIAALAYCWGPGELSGKSRDTSVAQGWSRVASGGELVEGGGTAAGEGAGLVGAARAAGPLGAGCPAEAARA